VQVRSLVLWARNHWPELQQQAVHHLRFPYSFWTHLSFSVKEAEALGNDEYLIHWARSQIILASEVNWGEVEFVVLVYVSELESVPSLFSCQGAEEVFREVVEAAHGP
jgi:hypothetical protein